MGTSEAKDKGREYGFYLVLYLKEDEVSKGMGRGRGISVACIFRFGLSQFACRLCGRRTAQHNETCVQLQWLLDKFCAYLRDDVRFVLLTTDIVLLFIGVKVYRLGICH